VVADEDIVTLSAREEVVFGRLVLRRLLVRWRKVLKATKSSSFGGYAVLRYDRMIQALHKNGWAAAMLRLPEEKEETHRWTIG
jgi:hypothetical protein